MSIQTLPTVTGDSREAAIFALAVSVAGSEGKLNPNWSFKPGTDRDYIRDLFAFARECIDGKAS